MPPCRDGHLPGRGAGRRGYSEHTFDLRVVYRSAPLRFERTGEIAGEFQIAPGVESRTEAGEQIAHRKISGLNLDRGALICFGFQAGIRRAPVVDFGFRGETASQERALDTRELQALFI